MALPLAEPTACERLHDQATDALCRELYEAACGACDKEHPRKVLVAADTDNHPTGLCQTVQPCTLSINCSCVRTKVPARSRPSAGKHTTLMTSLKTLGTTQRCSGAPEY